MKDTSLATELIELQNKIAAYESKEGIVIAGGYDMTHRDGYPLPRSGLTRNQLEAMRLFEPGLYPPENIEEISPAARYLAAMCLYRKVEKCIRELVERYSEVEGSDTIPEEDEGFCNGASHYLARIEEELGYKPSGSDTE